MEHIFYACKAGIKGGIARCLNEAGHCGSHPSDKTWPAAPQPTTLLLKVKLNEIQFHKNWMSLDTEFRLWSERRAMESEHVTEAERLGRKAYAARITSSDEEHLPESADSGCPVSGKNSGGWKSVNVSGIVAELLAAGFVVANASVLILGTSPNVRRFLVVAFMKDQPAYTEFPWEKFNRLVSGSYAFVHVWANALQSNGVKHTVNCIGREPDGKKPSWVLRYAGGDWGLISVSDPTQSVPAGDELSPEERTRAILARL